MLLGCYLVDLKTTFYRVAFVNFVFLLNFN